MNSLEFWMQGDVAKALGWTLMHSLWQGAAIALVLAIVFGIARSARVRYAAACVAMLALLVAFGVTFDRLAPRGFYRAASVPAIPLSVSPATNDHAAPRTLTWEASQLLPWVAPLWIAGVYLFQLRCLVAWMAAARLRRRGVWSAPAAWIEKINELRVRLRMTRPVTLLESCFAEVPVVIGHLRPIILMPVGLLAGLPAGQVEAILLHELAHIRRADYLVNLMQTIAEGLLFYHPAAWWISNAIRAERENCCDDLVVATRGEAHEYATALAALAENRWIARQPALAATGGHLVKRIRRLLAQPEGRRMNIAPVLSLGILIVTGAVAFAWQSPAPAQATPAASKFDRWLKDDVPYIITDSERAEYKKLQNDAERERFVDAFWLRRDPTPGTPENEYRDEHYRRITYANNRFATKSGLPGWKTDQGRIYIQYGPPDEIESHPTGGAYTRPNEEGGGQIVTYPFEQWRYRYIDGIGNNVIMEFVDRDKNGEYRLTMDPGQKVLMVPKQVEQHAAAVIDDRLPIRVSTSFSPVGAGATMTTIMVDIETKALSFQDKDNVSTASVAIYGRIATLARRPLAPFEDVVSVRHESSDLVSFINEHPSQIYEKSVALQPGSYRLDIAAKDLGSKRQSHVLQMTVEVPSSAAR